ncbi:hypothetical protein GCM10027570_13520 [Streptomonospora sediminis]
MKRVHASLPRYALELARRYWAPLLCVHLAGIVLHDAALRGAISAGLRDSTAGLLALSAVLLITVAATITMFHVLRPGLARLGARLPSASAGRPGVPERGRNVLDTVSTTILPFMVFYSAWGLIAAEFRSYALGADEEGGLGGFAVIADFDPIGVPLLVTAVAFAARAVLGRLYEHRGNRALGLCAALCEAVWAYFAVVTVGQLLRSGTDWLTDRAFWVGITSTWSGLRSWVADLAALLPALPVDAFAKLVGAALPEVWPLVKDGLLEPLLWLVITAIVFGADLGRTDTLLRGRAGLLAHMAARYIPGPITRVAGTAAQGLRDKYVPLFNALRVLRGAGPVFYLSFCIYYALLEAAVSLLHRGIFAAVGPAGYFNEWLPWVTSIELATGTLHEVLRMCLLTAAFALVVRRSGGAGTRAPLQIESGAAGPGFSAR